MFVLFLLLFKLHIVFCFFVFYYYYYVPFKSCGLPPECNIHCYVLDVSMPKHTMHCTPDLVTVLTPVVHLLVCVCGCAIDWLTSSLPLQCSRHDMLTCVYCMCLRI